MDIMNLFKSPRDVNKIIADNLKRLRLKNNLSQQGLAHKAGVSLGSLKRFEKTGDISLKSLVSLSFVLDRKLELINLFQEELAYKSLKEIKNIKLRKRGRKNV